MKKDKRSALEMSYGQELASDFGRRVRNYVSDPLHRTTFPLSLISDDSNAVHRFHLRAGGAYFAAGAGGPITGRGANLLLIDDPIKSREQANSAAERRSLQSWFESTAYPRLEDNGAIVVISTRWDEDDLPGWLLKEHAGENWRVICLPAIAEMADPIGRIAGAPLWPQKFPLNVLDRIREAIGSAAWTALYQQRPAAAEGVIFKREWWRRFAEPPADINRIIFSVDTAFKTAESNDFSVVEIWGQTAVGYYLLHVWRARVEFPELKRQAIALAEIWKPEALLIEDAASGQSLIQSLRSETRLPILPVKPLGDKAARASVVTPLIEAGRMYLPDQAPRLTDFLDELSSFPASPHDDQVDALTQALNYIRGLGNFNIMEHYRKLAEGRVAPPNELRDDPLGWREYGRARPPQWAIKSCRHCKQPIPDNTPYQQEPSGPWNSGMPFFSHPACAQRALAGILN